MKRKKSREVAKNAIEPKEKSWKVFLREPLDKDNRFLFGVFMLFGALFCGIMYFMLAESVGENLIIAYASEWFKFFGVALFVLGAIFLGSTYDH